MLFTEWKLEDAQQVWLEEGREEGIAEGEKAKALAIAGNALQMGMPIADISRLVGITEDEIKKLIH